MICSIILKTLVTHSVEGNSDLICPDGLCVHKAGSGGAKKKNVVLPIVASAASVVVLGFALALFFVFKKKKTSDNQGIQKKAFNLP